MPTNETKILKKAYLKVLSSILLIFLYIINENLLKFEEVNLRGILEIDELLKENFWKFCPKPHQATF